MSVDALAVDEQTTSSILGSMVREITAENPSLNNHEVTSMLISRLSLEDDPLAIVYPALAGYVGNVRRGHVRRVEHRLAANWKPAQHTIARQQAARRIADDMKEYATEYVEIPGVGRVRAGAVTVDEWQERTAMLKKGIERDQATVAFTEAIVGELHRAKAKNIDTYLKGAKK